MRVDRERELKANAPRALAILGFGVIACVFIGCTLRGLFIGFDGDDLMNLHEAVVKNPVLKLLLGLIVPFTRVNRPIGEAYYAICWVLFGWQPFGFRFVTYLLIAANVGLVYLLTRRLSETPEAAFAAALLFSFHGRLWQIYLSNSTVYDVLCAFFSLISMCYYARIRMLHKTVTWGQSIALTVLFIMALNAKEMAAALPLLFMAFDWTYVSPQPDAIRERLRWMVRHCRFAALLTVISAGAVVTKSSGPLAAKEYAVSLTMQRFFQNAKLIYSELFYLRYMQLNSRRVFLLWIAVFAIAVWSRKRSLRFLACFALLAPLPIMFIPWRGFFVMYFPLAAWSMFAGILLASIRERLFRTKWVLAGQVALAVVLLAMVLGGLRDPVFLGAQFDRKGYSIEQTKQDFLSLNEPMPAGGHILLLNSRFPLDFNQWYPLMIVQLLYNDRQLEVYRPQFMSPPPDEAAWTEFDRVMDYENGRLIVRRKRPGPAPLLLPFSGPRFLRLFRPALP